MPYPVIQTEAVSEDAGNVTTHPTTLPDDYGRDDLLAGIFWVNNSVPGTVTPPSGWTAIGDIENSPGWGRLMVKKATGSEGTSVNWTTTNACRQRTRVWRVEKWHGTTLPESVGTTSFSTTPNGPNLDPTWGAEQTLYMTVSIWAQVLSTYPSNCPDYRVNYGSALIGCAQAGAESSATSFDPSNFTITGNATWSAFTVAIRGGTAGAGQGGGQQGRPPRKQRMVRSRWDRRLFAVPFTIPRMRVAI